MDSFGQLPSSVEKSLRLLFAFAPDNEPMRLSSLARAAGVTRPTAHRLVTGLTAAGLLRYDPDDGTYTLGLRALDLGRILLETSPVRRASMPHLARLSRFCERSPLLTGPYGVYISILVYPG